MRRIIVASVLGCFLMYSCGPKTSDIYADCYKIDGDDVVYTCKDDTPDNPRANTGYDGPYNPKALNLYRPGRFENVNSPVW